MKLQTIDERYYECTNKGQYKKVVCHTCVENDCCLKCIYFKMCKQHNTIQCAAWAVANEFQRALWWKEYLEKLAAYVKEYGTWPWNHLEEK